MRILLVEDEARLGDALRERFERAGFALDVAERAASAEGALADVAYDALVLDLGLPDRDGLAVLEGLRRSGRAVPVLILTARDAVEDRVRGLDAGADDYLVKPFATEELLARVKALLRRPGHALGRVLEAGNLALDSVGRDVTVAGRALDLPRREIALLEELLRRLGRVVPRGVLEEKLYGMGAEPASNPVAVHVHHLRRHLERSGATARIHTVRGVGYVLLEGET